MNVRPTLLLALLCLITGSLGCCDHQLVANFICLLFGAGRVVYSGFIRDLEKMLMRESCGQ